MARITRKELKTDKFALEFEHGVTFFEEHRAEIIRYGGIAVAAILLIIGYMIYQRHQHTAREEALFKAIQAQEAPVGAAPGAPISFPTQEAKDQETIRLFSSIASKYSGSVEGEIAQYYIGCIKTDQGKLADAEKNFREVADHGDAKYSSLAKMALSQIYFSDGRDAEGEKVLRDLMAHPTIFVSKDQATIALARQLMAKKPAEARNLLKPLSTVQGSVGQVAVAMLGELPPQ